MVFVLARLVGLAALAWALALAGTLADRLSGGRLRLPTPRWLGRLLLGALLATAYLFALAAAGALSGTALLAGLVAVVAGIFLQRWQSPPLSPTGREPDSTAPQGRSWRGGELVVAVGVALLFGGLLLEALNPYPAWDAQAYHLTLPRLWIEAGGFVRVPFSVYSNWPSNLELLFAAAMLAGDYLLATLLHWGAGLALVVLLWRAGSPLVPRAVPAEPSAEAGVEGRVGGALAAVLLLGNDLVLFEAQAAYVDLAAALALLVAWLLAEKALERGGDRPGLLAAGVALGYLAGLKPNGLLAVAAVAPVVAFCELRRAGLGRAARAAALLVLPALALLAPWLLRAALQTGNPVYPFLFAELGGPEWSEGLSVRLMAWQQAIGMGREPLDYLLLPWRVIVEGGPGYARFDGRLGWQWLAAVPLALAAVRHPRVGRPFAVAGLSFALWAASAQQLRFLLPALALVALAAGRAAELGLAHLPLRWRSGRAARLAGVVAPLLALAVLAPPARRALETTPVLVREYLAHGGAVKERAVPPPFRALEGLLPARARVALINTNQSFFCPRPCLADSFFEASQLAAALDGAATASATRQRFSAIGATHLLIDARPRGIDWPAGLAALLSEPALAAPLWRSADGRYTLLELR